MDCQIFQGLSRAVEEGAAHRQLAESMNISVDGMMLIHPGIQQDNQNILLFST